MTQNTGTKAAANNISIKRIYDPVEKQDGLRVLVDRIWPRGLKKADAKIDLWLKEIAPSTELRKWFKHDPEKWPEFQKRYRQELKQQPDLIKPILENAKKHHVTLLFSAKDADHNNAQALKAFLST
jgi:uncharacterized protein YeaO (DUF488 family)